MGNDIWDIMDLILYWRMALDYYCWVIFNWTAIYYVHSIFDFFHWWIYINIWIVHLSYLAGKCLHYMHIYNIVLLYYLFIIYLQWILFINKCIYIYVWVYVLYGKWFTIYYWVSIKSIGYYWIGTNIYIYINIHTHHKGLFDTWEPSLIYKQNTYRIIIALQNILVWPHTILYWKILFIIKIHVGILLD